MTRTYLVVQWLNLLLFLPLTNLVRVSDFEELRGNIDEPLGLDCSYVMAILACREDEFMVDDPLGVPIEERRGRVDVHWCALDQRLVTFLWILLRGVSEET